MVSTDLQNYFKGTQQPLRCHECSGAVDQSSDTKTCSAFLNSFYSFILNYNIDTDSMECSKTSRRTNFIEGKYFQLHAVVCFRDSIPGHEPQAELH